MKSREEQLTWAKQRALVCVDVGHFSDAVAGLPADLDENPLTKGVVSIDQARREYKATTDARANGGMSWNKVSGRQAGAADSAPKEIGRGGYLRASMGPFRADDMPDELAHALADQHRGNPLARGVDQVCFSSPSSPALRLFRPWPVTGAAPREP